MVPSHDMVPSPPPLPPPSQDDGEPSPLWRELIDGTAGPVVKVFITFALIPLFIGLGLVASYVVAGLVSGGMRSSGPDDDIVGVVLAICAFLYLVSVAWVWTRQRRRHAAIWKAVAYTGAVVFVTVIAGIWIDDNLRRAGEILIVGSVFLALAAIILIWIEAARNYTRAKPLNNPTDGALDVRCPTCGYRMVGLHESRCPECGTSYTLDGLLGQQEFLTRGHRHNAMLPSGVPTLPYAATTPPIPPSAHA